MSSAISSEFFSSLQLVLSDHSLTFRRKTGCLTLNELLHHHCVLIFSKQLRKNTTFGLLLDLIILLGILYSSSLGYTNNIKYANTDI